MLVVLSVPVNEDVYTEYIALVKMSVIYGCADFLLEDSIYNYEWLIFWKILISFNRRSDCGVALFVLTTIDIYNINTKDSICNNNDCKYLGLFNF